MVSSAAQMSSSLRRISNAAAHGTQSACLVLFHAQRSFGASGLFTVMCSNACHWLGLRLIIHCRTAAYSSGPPASHPRCSKGQGACVMPGRIAATPKQRTFMSYIRRNADESLRSQDICGGVKRGQRRRCSGDDVLRSARKPACVCVSPKGISVDSAESTLTCHISLWCTAVVCAPRLKQISRGGARSVAPGVLSRICRSFEWQPRCRCTVPAAFVSGSWSRSRLVVARACSWQSTTIWRLRSSTFDSSRQCAPRCSAAHTTHLDVDAVHQAIRTHHASQCQRVGAVSSRRVDCHITRTQDLHCTRCKHRDHTAHGCAARAEVALLRLRKVGSRALGACGMHPPDARAPRLAHLAPDLMGHGGRTEPFSEQMYQVGRLRCARGVTPCSTTASQMPVRAAKQCCWGATWTNPQ